MKENPVIELLLQTEETFEDVRNRWTTYLRTSFENTTGKMAVNKLLETWNTWDLYSIHVMYISFMHRGGWLKRQHVCVKPYLKYVCSQVLLLPKERDDPTTTVQKLENIRGKIKRSEFVDFVKEMI